MSFPSLIYRCDQCDFAGGDASTWQRKEYALADGVLIPVKSRLGWCHDCNSVRDIEWLSAKSWQSDLAKASTELAELNRVEKKSLWQTFTAFLRPGRTRRLLNQRDERIQDCLSEIADANDGLELLRRRVSPPKCLTCGSMHVITDFFPPRSEEDEEARFRATANNHSTPVPTIHPGCGGQLSAEMSGMRFTVRPSVKRYTPEGDFLAKSEMLGGLYNSQPYYDWVRKNNDRLRSVGRRKPFPTTTSTGLPH